MDPDLEAFEAARSDRAKRTDYAGHKTMLNEKGVEVVAPDSIHQQFTAAPNTRATDEKRHMGTAADLARAYMDKHPELDALWGTASMDDLVQAVDIARATGNEEQRIKLDAYLMARFAPPRIEVTYRGGPVQ